MPILAQQSAIYNPHSTICTPRVACFTPLSPIASGISYYSEDLLPVLARALALDVYVDGYAPAERAPLEAAGVRLRQAREFDRVAARASYDATIYQFGNSPAHAYMYDRALRAPGIVVLHDVVLHHLRLWMAVNRGRRREYMGDLARLYGAAGGEVARAVLRGQMPPALFDYPLVEPVLDTARVVIVHNAASAERVRALRPGVDVRVVPMGVPLPAPVPRDEARARLGIAPDAFLVVSHGHVTPYKRLDVALRAFRRLVAERPDARFLIAGSEAPGLGELLERQIGYLGLGGKVTRLGFIPPATVADLLAAADCCVNLRYPSAGETSASLLRIMGAGLPVIVSDAGSFRELPDACAIKAPVGRLEEPLLAEYLLELARDDDLRSALGANARDFVATAHSLERSAEGYLDALGAVLGRTLTLPPATALAPLAASISTTAPPVRRSARLHWRPHFRNRNRRGAVAVASPDAADPLLDGVADALAELRLAGHEPTERAVAREIVALGLGAAGTQEKADG
jgi:glycosyltransferase involved in cell wall biosynthesis